MAHILRSNYNVLTPDSGHSGDDPESVNDMSNVTSRQNGADIVPSPSFVAFSREIANEMTPISINSRSASPLCRSG